MNDRELFEEWYKIHHHENIGLFDGENYEKPYQNTLWIGWKASSNRQDYKLVPVDELNRIIADTTDVDTYNDLKAMIGAVE